MDRIEIMDEKKVQTWALHYLHSLYQSRFPRIPSFADVEMELKKKEGYKRGRRADGLVCFRISDEDFYTIALEAKSLKTKGDLLNFMDKTDSEFSIIQFVIIAGLFAFPLILTLYLIWSFTWYWILLAVMGSLLVSFIMLIFYSFKSSFFKTYVHNQLADYKGNEKWIAISDELHTEILNVKSLSKFLKICNDFGFGLLIVNSNGKVNETTVKPKITQGQFLSYYLKEENIKRYFLDKQHVLKSYNGCINFYIRGKIDTIICKNPLMKIVTPKLSEYTRD